MKDYYKILGVEKSASTDEIKRAFHLLAHKHHPHKGGDESKFKEINEAYQILSNKEKRAQYDRFGQTFEGGNNYNDYNNWAWGSGMSGMPNMGFDMEDLSEIFGDIFGFGSFSSKGSGSRKRDFKKGADIRIDMEIPLETVLKDINKEINLYKQIICSRCSGTGAEPESKINECFSCRGTGEVQQVRKTFLGSFTHWSICPECKGEGQRSEKPCNVCQGEGKIKGQEKINISIPAGVDSNQLIKIVGKGEAGRRGGKPGDLYVRILVKSHRIFKREGDDLFVSIPISFSQAALGDEIEIPTLEGIGLLEKIPIGSESGIILKISKKGIPHFSSSGQGDLYVELIIKTPKNLTKRQKELLRQLREQGL